jgi:hypothetical protein
LFGLGREARSLRFAKVAVAEHRLLDTFCIEVRDNVPVSFTAQLERFTLYRTHWPQLELLRIRRRQTRQSKVGEHLFVDAGRLRSRRGFLDCSFCCHAAKPLYAVRVTLTWYSLERGDTRSVDTVNLLLVFIPATETCDLKLSQPSRTI